MIDIVAMLFCKRGIYMKFEETCHVKRDFQNILYGIDKSQNFDIIIPKEKLETTEYL